MTTSRLSLVWSRMPRLPEGLHSRPMRALVLPIVLSVACDQRHPRDETPVPRHPAPLSAAAAPSTCTITPLPMRLPAPKRLVAIGDVHGDLAGLRSALRA